MAGSPLCAPIPTLWATTTPTGKLFFAKNGPAIEGVFFSGESVAAGYLYAPFLTPAKVLEQQLNTICGASDFEIVDLARTNETIGGLTDTLESALQLNPDALVIFSGNNWTMLETPGFSPYAPAESKAIFGGLLREAGLYGAAGQASLTVFQKAGAAYARIDQAARAAGIPVILITPESNLSDWENRQPPPWLPGDRTARWYVLYEKALQQLQRADWAGAESSAWQMEEIDGTLCPATYRILAKSLIGQGAEAKARLACQAEVDANSYAGLCFLGAPQIQSSGRTLQQRAAEHHGFTRVDLAEVFSKHTGSQLPGRRMFLDYCHFTVEGMKVAMAAVAAGILQQTKHPKRGAPWETLVRQLPDPEISAEADATAKFGAAIHTAHRQLCIGDEQEMPEFWCREALRASPGIREAMADFAKARLAPLPAVLTAAQHQNYASPYQLTMQHGWKYDFVDAPMLRAIEATAGQDMSPLTVRFAKKLTDLVHPPFLLWNPVERFYPEVMGFRDVPGRAFFRAAWPISRFALPGWSLRPLRLCVTLRLPHIPGWEGKRAGPVFFKINGYPAGTVTAGEQWSKHLLLVPAAFLTQSINQLSICWPPLPPCGDAAWENAVSRLEQGLEADVHPVFGEIFYFCSLNITNENTPTPTYETS